MSQETAQHFDAEPAERPALRKPTVSDADGTREGGLVFCIAVIAAMIAAAALAPGALTSFWVWFGILAMAVAIAVNIQRLVSHWTGHSTAQETEDGTP